MGVIVGVWEVDVNCFIEVVVGFELVVGDVIEFFWIFEIVLVLFWIEVIGVVVDLVVVEELVGFIYFDVKVEYVFFFKDFNVNW